MSQNQPRDEFDFADNPALQEEVMADAIEWAGTIEPMQYIVGDTVADADASLVKGLMEAKPEDAPP